MVLTKLKLPAVVIVYYRMFMFLIVQNVAILIYNFKF